MAEEQKLRYIVRVANTDLEGKKSIIQAMTKIKGVGIMYSNFCLRAVGIDGQKRAGQLSDTEVKQIDEAVRNPQKYGAPGWMLNRRNDPDTGETRHLITSELAFAKDTDIKMMKKIRNYRGIRHMSGLPVRGQRTKSNFRRSKGKVMGVTKKAMKAQQARGGGKGSRDVGGRGKDRKK